MKVEHTKRLDVQDHRSLVLWATDCAEHVLPYFEEKYPKDDRPRKAVEAGRAWVRGEIALSEARAAAFAAHAAARDADQPAARAAARAAGHAAATAHIAGHAGHAAAYAVTAATYAAVPTDAAAATTKERVSTISRNSRTLPLLSRLSARNAESPSSSERIVTRKAGTSIGAKVAAQRKWPSHCGEPRAEPSG